LTAAAASVLRAVLTLPEAQRFGLSVSEDWQHTLTAMSDDGRSRFHFDNATGVYLVAERVPATGGWRIASIDQAP